MKLKFLLKNNTKSLVLLFGSILLCLNSSYAIEGIKITLQPDGVCGTDALIADCIPCGYYNTNYGDVEENNALAWTNGGSISDHRTLLNFDLSNIPTGSIVQSAFLTLYFNPSSSNAGGLHSQISGTNEAYIQAITSPWDEHLVTWQNQPSTTTLNEAYLAASTSTNQNYTVDVKLLIQDFVNDPSSNYGMMLKLATESYYRCLLFASSDHPNAALHPKLEVTYIPKDTSCFTLQYEQCQGIDALIADCIPCGYDTSNYGNTEELNALAWTNGGAISDHRSLLKWNLDNIPSNSTIISANLTLFYNPTSSNASGFHSTMSGSNAAYLQLITSPWDENTVTWNNQPTTTNINQAYLPASVSPTQDYSNIDVTALVQTMVNNPNSNWGMMLKLDVESAYRCLLFASSDHPNSALHPKLEVCYSLLNNSISENESEHLFSIYPNPNHGTFTLNIPQLKGKALLTIYNAIGELVYQSIIDESGSQNIVLPFAAGVYNARLTNNNKTSNQKFILN